MSGELGCMKGRETLFPIPETDTGTLNMWARKTERKSCIFPDDNLSPGFFSSSFLPLLFFLQLLPMNALYPTFATSLHLFQLLYTLCFQNSFSFFNSSLFGSLLLLFSLPFLCYTQQPFFLFLQQEAKGKLLPTRQVDSTDKKGPETYLAKC